MSSIIFLGHCTKDIITINNETQEIPGGGVYFGAASGGYCLNKYNKDKNQNYVLETVTIGKREDSGKIFEEMKHCGVKMNLIEDSKTTTFTHHFKDNKPDQRVSAVTEIARPFTVDDVKNYSTKFFYVNPLFYGEVPVKLFAELKKHCEILSCDAQGLLRQLSGDDIDLKIPSDIDEALKNIDLLKVDCVEASILTGMEGQPRDLCLKLLDMGPKAIIFTQSEGVEFHTKDKAIKAPFKQWSLEGRTGRGDTVSAAFIVLHYILGYDIEKALQIAADATGKKMMHPGAARADDFD